MKNSPRAVVATIGMTMIGMIGCTNFGTRTLLIPATRYPARNPVTIAPMNPAPASESYSSPVLAIQPPIMPGPSAGRSPIA
ncbi:hypothetical protein SGLAM104S_07296 [Streptomyces glaucescens]